MRALAITAAAMALLATFAVAAEETPEQAALRVLDEFMTAFNARDPDALAATLNYPHVRIASSNVIVTETAEEFAADMNFETFAQRFNWDRSAWGERTVIQAHEDKVHLAVEFTRYDKDGNPTATHESLYIITKIDDHWGVQARSSFAP